MMLLVKPDKIDTEPLYNQVKCKFTDDYCSFHKIPKNSLLFTTYVQITIHLNSIFLKKKIIKYNCWIHGFTRSYKNDEIERYAKLD